MTLLQSIELSIKLWRWLVDNFPATKDDFKGFDLSKYDCGCPLCDYHEFICEMCFLECFNIPYDYSAWSIYVNNNIGTKRKALAAAKRILRKLEKAYKEELEKENQ